MTMKDGDCRSLSSWRSHKWLENNNIPKLFSCVADYPSLHLQCGSHQIVSPQHGSAVWLPPELYWSHGPLHVHLWLLQTIQHSPLLISENPAVFLWNNTGFNFKVKKTLTLHKTSPPLLHLYHSTFQYCLWKPSCDIHVGRGLVWFLHCWEGKWPQPRHGGPGNSEISWSCLIRNSKLKVTTTKPSGTLT